MINKNHMLVELYIRTKLAERATTEDLFDEVKGSEPVAGAYLLYNPRTEEIYFGTTNDLYDCYMSTLKLLKEGTHWDEHVRESFLRMPCESPIFIPVRTNSVMDAFSIAESLCAGYAEHPKLLNWPMSFHVAFHNPLEKETIRTTVADALLNQPLVPLMSLAPFIGGGIYAIYYTGKFPAYTRKLEAVPLHVGKASPNPLRRPENEVLSQALYKRLREHIESIKQAENLEIEDFHCRLLRVDDFWTQSAVDELIKRFSPLWNTIVDGFGNHDPGGGRYVGVCSRWDILHPGRPWVKKCRPNDITSDDIIQQIHNHLNIEY